MKWLFFNLLLTVTVTAYGQVRINPLKQNISTYFDSVRIDQRTTFYDVQIIKEITVQKQDSSGAPLNQGLVYIKSKVPSLVHFMGMNEVLRQFNILLSDRMVFMVDNNIMKQIQSFKIDSSFILDVQTTYGSEISYLKNADSDFVIVNILTKSKANLDRKNQIRIRGINDYVRR